MPPKVRSKFSLVNGFFGQRPSSGTPDLRLKTSTHAFAGVAWSDWLNDCGLPQTARPRKLPDARVALRGTSANSARACRICLVPEL